MPRVTLLHTRGHHYNTTDDLDRLIKRHKELLGEQVDKTDKPGTDAAINAIGYNLILLMRERNRYKRQRGKLLVLDGGKKD